MKHIEPEQIQQQAVCGQAQTVLDNLARSRSLPSDLSLSIEEILERAWEIAYRRESGLCASKCDRGIPLGRPRAAS